MFREIGVLCCELIMHFRVVVSVSSRLDLAVMTDRDSGCSQLLRSSGYRDDLSQAMPSIFFASCIGSDLV